VKVELLFAGALLMATAFRIPSWDDPPALRPAAVPPVTIGSERDATPEPPRPENLSKPCRLADCTKAVANVSAGPAESQQVAPGVIAGVSR
jgi:hypothetical protein